MKNLYLTQYVVKGIKNLEQKVELNFYKKTVSNFKHDFKKYHIKGIYGSNGSGKTGIITSINILKNIVWGVDYLRNEIVQKQLLELINKRSNELEISISFLMTDQDVLGLFKYKICLKKNEFEFYIKSESLLKKNAESKSSDWKTMYEIEDGVIKQLWDLGDSIFYNQLMENSVNLLNKSSLCTIFSSKYFVYDVGKKMKEGKKIKYDELLFAIMSLQCAVADMWAYLDASDTHIGYFFNENIKYSDDIIQNYINQTVSLKEDNLLGNILSGSVYVPNNQINIFKNEVMLLEHFIKKFKTELKRIEIIQKTDREGFRCNLIMDYGEYSVDSEFESTGIKKLIKLYYYFKKMVNGGIVFIDELDANLNDVYLCALLEYMMNYGEGQLIFTTHNVGPMGILQKGKKSIDFLSVNHKVYSWVNNGNYSAAKLYKEGLIEGCPFNIEDIDFIGLFEEDKI